jgi:tetratricopeptide (TPR) repeat protein
MPELFLPLLSLFVFTIPAKATPAQAGATDDVGDTALEATTTRLLRLRDGNLLWGTIETHNPEGIGFRILETGGLLALPWVILDPTEEGELRLGFGYVEAQAEELMVEAHRFLLADGREIVGQIINRTDTDIWVKRAEGSIPVPKVRIRGASALVHVPALDIFTKDELYQKRVSELQSRLLEVGGAGARAHDELAQYCEHLFDYVHALEHYSTVRELAPDYNVQRISDALSRAQTKAALQEQVDYLVRIDLLRARKQYGKALISLDEFPIHYPDSALLEDWNKMRTRVAKHQERDARDLVVKRWHFWSVRLAREAARRKETYAEVIDYLDETMGLEILEAVRKDLERIDPTIEAETVRRLWDEREGGRIRGATYGTGTWLLGPESAKDLLEPEEEKDEPSATEGSAKLARKRFEEKIKRYLKNIELSRRSQASATGDADPEEFWKLWNLAGRSQWIHSYYVENSGDYRDLEARLSACRECGGQGFKEILFTGSAIKGSRSGDHQVPCPNCHAVQVVRRLRYR